MKKLLFFAFALLALNFTFTSCSDDDVNAPDSLVNTTWRHNYGEGEQDRNLMTFGINTVIMDYGSNGGIEEVPYSYSKPVVNVTQTDSNEEEVLVSGTVNGNKMTFIFEGETIVFIKQ